MIYFTFYSRFNSTVSCSSAVQLSSYVKIFVMHDNLKMHLYEYLHMTFDFDSLWNFLCEKQVVRREIMCPRCSKLLEITNPQENKLMHCTNKYSKVVRRQKRQRVTCNFKISALHGTWFSKIRMDLTVVCRFIGYFLMLRSPRHSFLMNELNINDHHVIVDWTNFCREVMCYTSFIYAY